MLQFERQEEEKVCILSDRIKTSNDDGKHMVIPLIKEHTYGSDKYQTIEFVLLDIDKLSLSPKKIQVNIETNETWNYDITGTLT